ncbi:MAG: PilZ domain-containing protein [Gammaproteobacteria bacterium]
MSNNYDERRRHFRVQDQLLVDYEVVTDAEVRGASNNMALIDPAELSATTSLRRIETELQAALGALSNRHGEIIRCLDLLNSKVNTLANLMPATGKQDRDLLSRDVCDCSLSSSGVAFTSRESLPLDARLRLRLVILPDYFHVTAFGEVVRVTPIENPENGFTHVIGVNFLHILDRYREALARRSLQREIEDRRDQRQREELAKELAREAARS